ncbi:putative sulfate exporter family transporter [soil metagenome]
MTARSAYLAVVTFAGVALVVFGAPSWLALVAGLAIALLSAQRPPAQLKRLTTLALQLGVVALGAGMNLVEVWKVGSSGAVVTAMTLSVAIGLGLVLGRALLVRGDTPLLIGVGTAICGGSAIAAVASVIRPKEHELSVSLAVVFVLNAVGLIVFPVIGHALGLSQPVFGRWAALAIHDTSSVVGAGLAYGPVALSVATTTKLARALWIVPITTGIAVARAGVDGGNRLAGLRGVRWPWFILGFVAVAAAFTWLPSLAPASHPVVTVGQRALVLALFLIGLSLSREALSKVGIRPLVLGVALWLVVASISLPLAAWLG